MFVASRAQRSLDWETDGPFQRFPQVTVYHGDGSASQGATFANVGWSGWIGAVSGMSEHAVAIFRLGALVGLHLSRSVAEIQVLKL